MTLLAGVGAISWIDPIRSSSTEYYILRHVFLCSMYYFCGNDDCDDAVDPAPSLIIECFKLRCARREICCGICYNCGKEEEESKYVSN